MKSLIKGLLAGGTAIVATVALAVPAGATTRVASGPQYYLSLGDSLAQGYEPNAQGIGLDTDNGYVDDIYNAELTTNPSLQLVKMGCPGETTKTFLLGGVCPLPPQIYRAVNFLKKYGSQTAFVTIDIGANNVDNCVVGGVIDAKCVAAGFAAMGKQLPKILTRLRAADPTVPIYAMNYYDPFLAAYLTGTAGAQEAGLSIPLSNTFNADEAAIYSAFGVTNVDVSNGPADPNLGGLSFSTGTSSAALEDFSGGYTLPVPGVGNVPVPNDVYGICALTYMCQPAPVGPNIHANNLGYQYIADQFLAAMSPVD